LETDIEVFKSTLFPEGGRGDLRVVGSDKMYFCLLVLRFRASFQMQQALPSLWWCEQGTTDACLMPETCSNDLGCKRFVSFGSPFSWAALEQLGVFSCCSPSSDALRYYACKNHENME